MLPSQFFSLPKREQAFLIASIEVKAEADKKAQRKMQTGAKRKR
jgi:hypothetical protein